MIGAERRRAALEAGLCHRCMKEPPERGLTSCKRCRAGDARRRHAATYEIMDLRCGACGSVESYRLFADEVLCQALARTKCLFCGEKKLAREPRK